MKVLLILRHAKSSWSDTTLDDHERPLNRRGERDAPRMGAFVREQRLMPDVIVSSDATRARMTAEEVARGAGYAGEIVFDPLLYLAGPEDIFAVLRALPDDQTRTVMIVGHNPGLEDLLAQLTGESHDLPTAALAHIRLPIERWREVDADTPGELAGVWRPRELA